MSLHIGFIVNIKSELVAQFVETPALRIVAQPNSVQVVLFHQFKIFTHQLFGHVMSCFRVVFVDINALKFYRLTIYKQQGMRFPRRIELGSLLYFDSPETYIEWYHFADRVIFFYSNNQFIQVRLLRTPCCHIG